MLIAEVAAQDISELVRAVISISDKLSILIEMLSISRASENQKTEENIALLVNSCALETMMCPRELKQELCATRANQFIVLWQMIFTRVQLSLMIFSWACYWQSICAASLHERAWGIKHCNLVRFWLQRGIKQHHLVKCKWWHLHEMSASSIATAPVKELLITEWWIELCAWRAVYFSSRGHIIITNAQELTSRTVFSSL